jgi:TM2 domain-containing membrane protein YozV
MKNNKSSNKKKMVALLLSVIGFFGVAGIHRFYVGKVGTGVLWLLTWGFFGVGTLIDLIMIATENFKDKEGNVLNRD